MMQIAIKLLSLISSNILYLENLLANKSLQGHLPVWNVFENQNIHPNFQFIQNCRRQTRTSKSHREGIQNMSNISCYMVSHFDPYVRLGPFRLETKFVKPFRSVIHDFFGENEIDWIVKYSKPRLSSSREAIPSNENKLPWQKRYRDKKTGGTVVKTVTTWFDDITYNEKEIYQKTNSVDADIMFSTKPLNDPYRFTVVNPVMLKISKRIELVIQFNVTQRHASSQYQTTNYGLAGLAQIHNDAWGYAADGVKLVEDRKNLITNGDFMATFMGWLSDTEQGGNTAFVNMHGLEQVQPERGSAAFWINLYSCQKRDFNAAHLGCPVLKGQKWILNKWINSFDQWKHWPCRLDEYLDLQNRHGWP